MANKFDGDVRPLSNDPRYMGVVFGGVDTIDEAIDQARAMPDHGVAEQVTYGKMNGARAALLEHLNILHDAPMPDDEDWSVAYGAPAAEPKMSFSLAHAQRMGWLSEQSRDAIQDLNHYELMARIGELSPSQQRLYAIAREDHDVRDSLAIAEAYPYPAALS